MQAARIQWREGGTPESDAFGDVYFSRDGGLAESEYVFFKHNGLPARFAQAQDAFFIAETGFGTGLNALLTFEHWQRTAPPHAVLHFISFEKFPLRRADLIRAHAAWPELAVMAQQLQAGYPPLTPGWHHVPIADNILLWLWFGDVHEGLADLEVPGGVDAWYLDGFAPSKNPDMWTAPLYEQMARLSHAETTFATFTAAGVVRRGLEAAGFAVDKVPGFGRKREMICGHFAAGAPRQRLQKPEQVQVVGAGLAGAAAARVLADAGMAVTVYEAESPGAGASGNWAGVLHPLVTADWSLRSQWYQLALEQALPRWRDAIAAGVAGRLSGLDQLLVTPAWQVRFEKFAHRFPDHDLFHVVEKPCKTAFNAVHYPQGGWLSPPKLVQHLLDHPRIEMKRQKADVHSRGLDKAMTIWATGVGESPLRSAIRPVKGQVSRLSGSMPALHEPLVHQGYSVPTTMGLITGATFEKTALDQTIPTREGHAHNRQLLAQACPELELGDTLEGRVSLRPTTRDHMPIIGVDAARQQAFSLGHGARGLISVWYAAHQLATQLGACRRPCFIRIEHQSRISRV
ncbi:tRNA 5-methylaminomethyl-2-thiouridine biosynthesis bifunctional protein [Sulfurivirga caldicuralii]|uniref:tRNA 5-methylaminomethyl-2-thiouridine biosynthesis bifunctional protein MnmC n=1 Tax=Sulfurivirga caldicuralii TaxID=364032 RepID=A0A1N6DDI2_9GAMM|nr:tRNA 5-methylaminomethyl-2-thiouridine biosynthesis bifunctional protein [Sulfurivirga caldicuralii]